MSDFTRAEPRYEVVVCAFCRRQATWARLDRLVYCWQCNNPDHGYKYLSALQVETIEVEERPRGSSTTRASRRVRIQESPQP